MLCRTTANCASTSLKSSRVAKFTFLQLARKATEYEWQKQTRPHMQGDLLMRRQSDCQALGCPP